MDPTSLSPIEGVLIKYNFLVVLPKTRRPQNYSLSIRIASRVSVIYKMREEMPVQIFRMMGMRNAMVTIQYVDYVVARNLADGVDRWFKGLPNYQHPKWLKWIRKNSETIRRTFAYVVGAFGVYLVLRLVPVYISSTAPDFQILANFGILGSLAIFGMYRMGRFFGSQLEQALDESLEFSYIQLNRGDEQRIVGERSKFRMNIARGAFGTLGTVALGVVSNYVANWLGG